MPLIGFAMARFLLPFGPLLDHFVAEATRRQQFEMSRQNNVNWILGDQRHGSDLNHRAPGFGVFGLWKADCYHIWLPCASRAIILGERGRNRNIPWMHDYL